MIKLSDSFLKQYIDAQPLWGPIGYITYKRTYARFIPELGRTEEWNETCARICDSIIKIGGKFSERELEQLYAIMFNLNGLPAGRILWQLGSKTVERVGADSLSNCWVTALGKLDIFTFIFDQLLLGGGIGFNILPEYVYSLPTIQYDVCIKRTYTADCDFVVPDNREGWVELLRRVLKAFFTSGKSLSYSTQCVRPAGQLMHSFGGKASGPEHLVLGIHNITKILRQRVGQKLRPIDCLDIVNILGVIGINSGVKRSSELAIGDINDPLYLNAKNRASGFVPNWRAMSNNTLACNSYDDLNQTYWDQFEIGEICGLINLRNCQRFDRLIDGQLPYPDTSIIGTNACGEFTGANMEPCNLADIFLPNIRCEEHFKLVARLLYKVCKTITTMGFSYQETNEVVGKNHKVGISLTGWMAAKQCNSTSVLDSVYKHLQAVDEDYSRELGCARSSKLTVIKPSGTLSLLPNGITPGMHSALSRYIIRRIRFNADDPLVETCHNNGYLVEPRLEFDGSEDPNTVVVSFPLDFGADAITEDALTVQNELSTQKLLQTHWSDQAVSCTHYYKPDEVSSIKGWLQANYDDCIKTVSFLPLKHGFVQAPMEKISEDQYHLMSKKCTPITKIVESSELTFAESLECSTGGCPTR